MKEASRDADGFKVVRKRGRSSSSQPRPRASQSDTTKYTGLHPSTVAAKIHCYRTELEGSQFYEEFTALLAKPDCPKFQEVVCFGIGHVGTCPIAQQQFSLLLSVSQHCSPDCVWLFDPVLYSEELAAITEHGIKILPENKSCKHRVQVPTLFYMPHCGKAMYNNLLWANWSPGSLPLVTIIGNSLSSYHVRLPAKQLKAEAPYIQQISSFCQEHPLPSSYTDPTVFNDLALHIVSQELLSKAPPSVWENCTEPLSDPNDPEIIS